MPNRAENITPTSAPSGVQRNGADMRYENDSPLSHIAHKGELFSAFRSASASGNHLPSWPRRAPLGNSLLCTLT
jgi:hypothetical protein